MSIAKGDIITILWENLPTLFNVEVVYIPTCAGDAWVVKDKDGTEFCIMSYCIIRKEKK